MSTYSSLCSSLWARSVSYSMRMEFLKGLGGRFLSKAFCKHWHKTLICSAHLCSYWYHHGCEAFPLQKLHWLFSCLLVCKYPSLLPLTCLMLKWSLRTCVSPGCARIPLKKGIISMQPFGVKIALNKNLTHSLNISVMSSLVFCNSIDIWAGPLPQIIYPFFFLSSLNFLCCQFCLIALQTAESDCHDLPDHIWREHFSQ